VGGGGGGGGGGLVLGWGGGGGGGQGLSRKGRNKRKQGGGGGGGGGGKAGQRLWPVARPGPAQPEKPTRWGGERAPKNRWRARGVGATPLEPADAAATGDGDDGSRRRRWWSAGGQAACRSRDHRQLSGGTFFLIGSSQIQTTKYGETCHRRQD